MAKTIQANFTFFWGANTPYMALEETINAASMAELEALRQLSD